MIRKWIGGLCLLLISIAASAQLSEANRAIIYTYDGSVFIGDILQEKGLAIELKTATNNRLFIQKGLIKRIKREADGLLIHSGGSFHYTRGGFISTTFGWGGDFNINPTADLDLIIGRYLNQRFAVGIGAAMNFNSATISSWGWVDQHFIPVFAYGRYYLTHKKARIFAYSRIGYGFPLDILWSNDHRGGVHFQPGIGLHFAALKSGHFLLTLGQMIQHTQTTITSRDNLSNLVTLQQNQWYNRTILKIGVSFDFYKVETSQYPVY